MLDIKYYTTKEAKYEKTIVIINGIEDDKSHVFQRNESKVVWLYNEKIIENLENEKVNDIMLEIDEIKVQMDEKYYPETITVNDWSYIEINKNKGLYLIKFKYQYDYELWNKSFTIKEMGEKLKEYCRNKEEVSFEQDDEDTILNGFSLCCTLEDTFVTLGQAINSKINLIKNIFITVVEALDQNLKNRLDFEFSVNENIKVVCEQYLSYFIQFLRDIGIEAESKIITEPFKILFSVTPKDNKVGLEQIHAALDLYLEIPKYPELIYGEDIAVLQLQSNIDHLNSQLKLAKATIIAQEKTIETLEIIKYQHVIGDNISNEEGILNNLITVTEYEKNGFRVDLPKIIRSLKRKIYK